MDTIIHKLVLGALGVGIAVNGLTAFPKPNAQPIPNALVYYQNSGSEVQSLPPIARSGGVLVEDGEYTETRPKAATQAPQAQETAITPEERVEAFRDRDLCLWMINNSPNKNLWEHWCDKLGY